MKKLTNTLMRGLVALTVAAVGLAVTPAPAQAAFIDFTVDETAVPLSNGGTFTADLINGGYQEELTLTPTSATEGTFSAVAFATFGQYFLDGSAVLNSDIGGNQLNAATYRINATLVADGTYTQNLDGTAFTFTGDTGIAQLFLDPLNNTTGTWVPTGGTGDDVLLVTSNTLLPGSGGSFDTNTSPITGNFNLVFGNTNLTALGEALFPTLANLILTATVNGDFNEILLENPQIIEGDVSVQFEGTPVVVPEPATLTLLGMGLFGAGVAARRRRKA